MQVGLAKEKITYQPEVKHYILALASTLKDYRLSYFINDILAIELSKLNDLIYQNKEEGKAKKHSLFSFFDEDEDVQYYLLQNKLPDNVIIKSLKNFDYLFIVKTIDEENTYDINFVYSLLNKIDDVQLIFKVDSLKSAEHKIIAKEF